MTLPQRVVAWVRSLAGAFVVVVILNGLAIAAFEVPTGSMENTVMAGGKSLREQVHFRAFNAADYSTLQYSVAVLQTSSIA